MSLKLKKPLFITFEGGEGTGKTTQINNFLAWLQSQISVVLTTESHIPGIRKLLWEVDADYWEPLEEAFLLVADRSKHLRDIIHPHLKNGTTVISDRYYDSSYVYQHYVRGLSKDTLDFIHQEIAAKTPDITIILDIDPKVGLARKGKQAEEGLTETRFEDLGLGFHNKVRTGYQTIATKNPNRCILVDATGTIEDVQQRIRQAFLAKAKEKGLL